MDIWMCSGARPQTGRRAPQVPCSTMSLSSVRVESWNPEINQVAAATPASSELRTREPQISGSRKKTLTARSHAGDTESVGDWILALSPPKHIVRDDFT